MDGKLTNTPWEDNGWTKSRYFSFIRSALRSATMKYPAKQKFLSEQSRKAPAGGRAKRVVDCVECGETMAKSNAHVDHIIACGKLQDFSDIERFTSTLFCGKENFRVLCKECNEIYAHSDRKGISFEEAKAEKKVIAILNTLSILEQKKILLKEGFSISAVSNAALRRKCFTELERKKPNP